MQRAKAKPLTATPKQGIYKVDGTDRRILLEIYFPFTVTLLI